MSNKNLEKAADLADQFMRAAGVDFPTRKWVINKIDSDTANKIYIETAEIIAKMIDRRDIAAEFSSYIPEEFRGNKEVIETLKELGAKNLAKLCAFKPK